MISGAGDEEARRATDVNYLVASHSSSLLWSPLCEEEKVVRSIDLSGCVNSAPACTADSVWTVRDKFPSRGRR